MGVKKIPMRMCVGCREMKPKRELARIVKTSDGEVKTDIVGKVNGRGAYICKNAECLKKAIKTGAISRALETEIPAAVYNELEESLKNIE
ncbi:MAG: YlxR family protein [Clostridia bacterium]|nr:YlxR family protein [Clostridia bacterium]